MIRPRRLLSCLAALAACCGPAACSTPPEAKREITAELALATFDEAWERVRETHFDQEHLKTVGWDDVRRQLRPKAAEAATDAELRAVLREMLRRLGQSHFAVLPGEAVDALEAGDAGGQRDGTVGLDLRLVEGRFVVTRVEPGSAAEAAGVRAGWILRRVGDDDLERTLAGFLDAMPEPPAARLLQAYAWRMAETRLSGDVGETVELELLDGDDEARVLEVTRKAEEGVPSKLGNLPTIVSRVQAERLSTPAGSTVGLLRFNIWLVPILQPLREAVTEFHDADGIILDLRGNPGGIGGLSMTLAGHFLEDRSAFGTLVTRDQTLEFVAFPQRVDARGRPLQTYGGPLVILVDALTGSTSEIFAGGMQSIGRARIIGRRTMGAALPALMPELPNGDVLMHAFADFTDARGERLEGRGVVPDEEVTLTRAALLSGEDPAVRAALRWIDEAGAAAPPKGRPGDSQVASRNHQPEKERHER